MGSMSATAAATPSWSDDILLDDIKRLRPAQPVTLPHYIYIPVLLEGVSRVLAPPLKGVSCHIAWAWPCGVCYFSLEGVTWAWGVRTPP